MPQERFLEIVVAPDRVEESNESTNLIFVWQHHPKSYAAMVAIDSISTFLGEIVEGLHWDHHCYIQQTPQDMWQNAPGTEVVVLQIPLPVKLNVLCLGVLKTGHNMKHKKYQKNLSSLGSFPESGE